MAKYSRNPVFDNANVGTAYSGLVNAMFPTSGSTTADAGYDAARTYANAMLGKQRDAAAQEDIFNLGNWRQYQARNPNMHPSEVTSNYAQNMEGARTRQGTDWANILMEDAQAAGDRETYMQGGHLLMGEPAIPGGAGGGYWSGTRSQNIADALAQEMDVERMKDASVRYGHDLGLKADNFKTTTKDAAERYGIGVDDARKRHEIGVVDATARYGHDKKLEGVQHTADVKGADPSKTYDWSPYDDMESDEALTTLANNYAGAGREQAKNIEMLPDDFFVPLREVAREMTTNPDHKHFKKAKNAMQDVFQAALANGITIIDNVGWSGQQAVPTNVLNQLITVYKQDLADKEAGLIPEESDPVAKIARRLRDYGYTGNPNDGDIEEIIKYIIAKGS